MYHDNYNTTHDQIAAGGGSGSFAPRTRCHAGILLEGFAAGLHAASTFCPVSPQDLLQDRLPRLDRDARGFLRTPRRSRARQSPSLLDALQGPSAVVKKGEPVFLLIEATVRAQDSGLIK